MLMPDYRSISHELLAQAREELAQGDLRQASEKGWGAAAHMVKAVAAHQGRFHSSHQSLRQNVKFMAAGSRDTAIEFLFDFAEQLHRTFYETPLPAHHLAARLDQVETLTAKLEKLLLHPTQ